MTLGVRQFGKDLGADFALMGSLRRAGEDVRINAQLVAIPSGKQRWAQRFDRRLSDIFELQDDVNKEFAAALRLRFASDVDGSAVRRGTDIVDAYDYVLRGTSEARTFTKEGEIRARYCFEQALKLDAGYSAAYARLSVIYVYWWIAGWTDSREESLEQGLELAKQAVALDDGTSLCHAALCWALLWTKTSKTLYQKVSAPWRSNRPMSWLSSSWRWSASGAASRWQRSSTWKALHA